MKLTNEQRRVVQQAARDAIKAHFTGEGATAHRLRFLRDGLLASGTWACGYLFLASWAIVAGLLIGPDHEFFFRQGYAWVLSTPVEHALAQAHTMTVSFLWDAVKIGLIGGFAQKLILLTKPAVDAAKQQIVQAGLAKVGSDAR